VGAGDAYPRSEGAGQRRPRFGESVGERLIHALRMQAKRGKIAVAGKERGAIPRLTIG
jgi:hypothetical protein